jgi:type II secretory pathway pseudopilin PulG
MLPRSVRRRGITLTEILIAIMILGIGLVSLATLFPIGLLRLRDANRYTRSALLTQTAASDATARGLFNRQSFVYADLLNLGNGLPLWYPSALSPTGRYSPFIQDTAFYGSDPFDPNNPGASAVGGPGLPFAYDPLWRFQTGIYLDPINQSTLEARFASGIGFIRPDPFDGGLPSAHGLQRVTNFNRPFVTNALGVTVPIMPAAASVPNIFVSQEDVVWVEALASNPNSPVLPDLSLTRNATPTNDWRYSWMFTGQQSSASNSSSFDGNIVIFENRYFGISIPGNLPFPPGNANLGYQVDGEIVVEAIFGYSNNVLPAGGPGYGTAADRTVLLRWPTAIPDPVVRPGNWIADVTYERQALVIYNPNTGTGRFLNGAPPAGVPNPTNNLEWDNLPAQRCYWYQVTKVVPPVPDQSVPNHRSMIVQVNQSLQSKTVLNGAGNPVVLNAALIAPNVINVIPQTIFVR